MEGNSEVGQQEPPDERGSKEQHDNDQSHTIQRQEKPVTTVSICQQGLLGDSTDVVITRANQMQG
jgi:hypothetical protein